MLTLPFQQNSHFDIPYEQYFYLANLKLSQNPQWIITRSSELIADDKAFKKLFLPNDVPPYKEYSFCLQQAVRNQSILEA